MPDAVAAVYRVFRVLDALVLAGSLVAIILWLPSRIPVLVLVIAVWLFALVEYANYFVVRLSYPLTQWASRVGEWRTPQLIRDLRRSSQKLEDGNPTALAP